MANAHGNTIAGQTNAKHANEHHIMPVPTYFKVYIGLMILTLVTVGAAYINFHPHILNVIVAMLIACCKASLVVLFFMHQKYETRVNRLIFISGFLFLSILLTVTGIDDLTRINMKQDPEVFTHPAHAGTASGGKEAKEGANKPVGQADQQPATDTGKETH